MIGYFPEPYPDELLYSLCARLQDRMNYPTSKRLVEELFGTPNTVSILDLPTHLGYFISILPPNHSYTVDSLINNHTLFPFYSFFLKPEQSTDIREKMQQNTAGGIYPRSSLMASPVLLPQRIRFCSKCAEIDKEKWGEFYWHRLHQLPGVEVCHVHCCWLEQSDVLVLGRERRHEFMSAEKSIKLVPERQLSLVNSCHQELINIARDANWLLENHLSIGLDSIRKKYLVSFYQNQLSAYSTTQINLVKLVKSFKEYHTSELLELLKCSLTNKSEDNNWLTRLVQRMTEIGKSPILHLLLIHCLGLNIESFMALPTQLIPFGESPWPCLNPVCFHYLIPVINTCEISYKGSSAGRPIGSFSCLCGFIYSRKGPDVLHNDRLRYTRVLLYGHVWETTLTELWNDDNLGINQIAEHLKVSRGSIYAHANRLQLRFPRANSRNTERTHHSLKEYPHQYVSSEILSTNILEKNRNVWLKAVEDNSTADIGELRFKLPDLCGWLGRHDREWFNQHKPIKKRRNTPKLDWSKRDLEYLEKAKVAVNGINNLPGKPQRVTKQSIGKFLGITLFSSAKKLNKLPLTSAYLAEVNETVDIFIVNRIKWVNECYKQENIIPSKYQFIRRVGLGENSKSSELVKNTLDDTLEDLHNFFNFQ